MKDSSYLWWENIPSNKNHAELILNSLLQSKLVIIHNAEKIPFVHDLKRTVSSKLHGTGKSFHYTIIEDISDPGKTLFDNFGSSSRRSLFRPGTDYGAFLGESPQAPFHERLIWVRCIKDSTHLEEWIHFIDEYLKHRNPAIKKDGGSKAMFVLEVSSELKNSQSTRKITKIFNPNKLFPAYAEKWLDSFNIRIFATLILEECFSQEEKIPQKYSDYVADLATHLANEDPELCKRLLEKPLDLFNDPIRRYLDVTQEYRPLKAPFTKEELEGVCWTAQLAHAFPIIEKIRKYILTKYDEKYSKLPVRMTYYGPVVPPEGIEIGPLRDLAKRGKWHTSYDREKKDEEVPVNIEYLDEELHWLDLAADSRNAIAHLDCLKSRTMKQLFDVNEILEKRSKQKEWWF